MSLGGYPLGADFDRNAPWNETDVECPVCKGTGYRYYALDIQNCDVYEVSEEEYEKLPFEVLFTEGTVCQDSAVECLECGGCGRIYYNRGRRLNGKKRW